ncbi:MAG: hypothetical protein ABDH28_03180, partial [Brevinematia bacterium]
MVQKHSHNIGFLEFTTKKEILNAFFMFKNILKEKDEIALGIALIKSGYALPGLRVLYRYSTADTLKRIFSKVILLPSDIANIFFQTVSLNDVKLRKFVNSVGILSKEIDVKSIEELDVKEVIINGFPDDINLTKLKDNTIVSSINYYVDESNKLVVLVNGLRFFLPNEITQFVGKENLSIQLKAILNFGFPDERVFFRITKCMHDSDTTPYFDPMIKIDSLIAKIEAEEFV